MAKWPRTPIAVEETELHTDLDDLAPFEFCDPYTGQSEEMWVSIKHMHHMKGSPHSAMLTRPRLTVQDLRDMVSRPEMIQLFQYKDSTACLSGPRRYAVATKFQNRLRGIQWRQLRGRLVPRPPL